MMQTKLAQSRMHRVVPYEPAVAHFGYLCGHLCARLHADLNLRLSFGRRQHPCI